MFTGLVFFIMGVLCGWQWPARIGLGVTVIALFAIAATWYADHSPDEVFDLFEDYCEKFISRLVLPWAAGALLGALLIVL